MLMPGILKILYAGLGPKFKWLLRNNPCHFTLGVHNSLK